MLAAGALRRFVWLRGARAPGCTIVEGVQPPGKEIRSPWDGADAGGASGRSRSEACMTVARSGERAPPPPSSGAAAGNAIPAKPCRAAACFLPAAGTLHAATFGNPASAARAGQAGRHLPEANETAGILGRKFAGPAPLRVMGTGRGTRGGEARRRRVNRECGRVMRGKRWGAMRGDAHCRAAAPRSGRSRRWPRRCPQRVAVTDARSRGRSLMPRDQRRTQARRFAVQCAPLRGGVRAPGSRHSKIRRAGNPRLDHRVALGGVAERQDQYAGRCRVTRRRRGARTTPLQPGRAEAQGFAPPAAAASPRRSRAAAASDRRARAPSPDRGPPPCAAPSPTPNPPDAAAPSRPAVPAAAAARQAPRLPEADSSPAADDTAPGARGSRSRRRGVTASSVAACHTSGTSCRSLRMIIGNMK